MQKINLYTFLPKPKSTILNFKMMSILYGVFLSLLVLNYCGGLIYRHHLNSKLMIIKGQLFSAQQVLAELSAKYGKIDTSSIQLIENKSLACQIKFSAYLEDISHAIPAGVWLTHFSLMANGSRVVLNGNAIQASLVEEFLARLNKEPGFLSKGFEIQELNRMNEAHTSSDSEAQSLGFTLVTKA